MEAHRNFQLYIRHFLLFMVLVAGFADCGGRGPDENSDTRDTLVLGAYTVPKEVYQKEILPEFQRFWKERTGRDLKFDQSYVGSGAQARAIIGGFEADVAALSLEGDLEKIAEAGLITHDWRNRPWRGIITRSLAVIIMVKEPKRLVTVTQSPGSNLANCGP